MIRLSAFPFAALVVSLLAVLAAALALGGPESPLDRSLLILLQVDALVPAARLATRLGDWWLALLLGGLAAAWLACRRRFRHAAVLIVLLVSQRVIVEQLKIVLDRARPDPAGHLVAVHSMAFPSGHAANAITLGLGMALLLAPPGRGRTAALAAALLFAFLIGVTRLVVGVHWPSDVVGGWALGALWTLLLVRLAAGTSPAPRH